jgi:4-amino-4-deoxy-L-arabinose transferase-like glycosyltransferase
LDILVSHSVLTTGTCMSIFPILAFLGCWSALYAERPDWRECFISSAVLWGVWVAVSTEALGRQKWLSGTGIAAAWAFAAALACAVAIYRLRTRSPYLLRQSSSNKFSCVDKVSLSTVGVILLLTGLVAIVAPPNTWDAMQYSMPRVVMWLQNRSVSFYPTVDYQQLTMSPWADYAMMHLTGLHRGDRFASLVAWFAFAGSIVGVSLIAREFGMKRPVQIEAALLCATLPSAILFASSSKPDETVAFWIVVSVYFLLRWRSAPHWTNALLAAAAISLAIMTKGTAYLLVPGVVLAVFWSWPMELRKRFLPWIPTIALVVLALNGPLYVRNMRLSGSPLGFSSPDGEADALEQRHFANGEFGLRAAASNVLRNVALHLGTPSQRVNALTERVFRRLIRSLGVDPDDPKMLEGPNSGGYIAFSVPGTSLTETMAGNTLHLFLLFATLPLVFRLPSPLRRNAAIFTTGLIVAFVLFCAGIRWQPWNARFHLPLFMLGCALIAIVIAERFPKFMTSVVFSAAALGCVPFLFLNSPRPLVEVNSAHRAVPVPSILGTDRNKLYFADQHLYLADSYIAAAHFVQASGCRDVGLDASVLHFDYPMLALLRVGIGGPVVRYMDVHNRSANTSANTDSPCAIVCVGCALVHQKSTLYEGPSVSSALFGRIVVFVRSKQSLPSRARETAAAEPAFCDLLPADVVQRLIGYSVAETPEKGSCTYASGQGVLLVADITDGPDTGEFRSLGSESMGSLQVGNSRYGATIVMDDDRPAILYLRKGNRTFAINLDRPDEGVAPDDLLLLAEGLRVR